MKTKVHQDIKPRWKQESCEGKCKEHKISIQTGDKINKYF